MWFPSVTVVTVGAALIAGMLGVLGVGIKDRVAKRLGLSNVQTAYLTAALGLAAVVLLPVAGLLTDHFGSRPVLCTGSLLAAVALALLALTEHFAGALLGALLLGNASACLVTAGTVLMPAAFSETNPGAALSLGYAVLGLGLLLAPWLLDSLCDKLDWRRALGVLALLVLLPALLAGLTDVQAFPGANGPGAPGHARPVAGAPGYVSIPYRPEFWLIALAFLLYLPMEQALRAWTPRYLSEVGQPERRAAHYVTGFWLLFLAGRFVAAGAWERGWFGPSAGPWLVLSLALAASVLLGNLIGARGRRLPAMGLLGVGLLLGPVFPSLALQALERFAPSTWGTAFGGSIAVGWLGAHLVEPVLALYGRRTTVRQALWVLLVGLVLLALLMLVMGMARTLG